MKKYIFLSFMLSFSLMTFSQNVAVSTNTTDWWPQLGQAATNLTTPDGWYYRTNAGSERLAFDGTLFSGTACATTFGSIGAPYTGMSIKFDMTMPAPGSGKSSIIILGSNAQWGGQGIIIEYTEFGVRALKNFDYSAMTWMGSGTGYTDVLGTGGIKADNEINISATGEISLKFGTFVCPTTYQADVTVLGNTFVLVCPFATGFKFKNVIAKKGAVAKSYFPNYSYAIAATSNDDLKGTVTGAGTFDKTSDVTLTAAPAPGYKFINWTEGGAEVSTSSTYTFQATVARTLVANFDVSPVIPENVAVSTNTTDWWPQLGQAATNLTTPDGWYYRANAGSERLAFDGTAVAGTSCATTFGSIGAPYTGMSIKFDMTMPAPGSGKSSIIILGSNAQWGGQGIVIEYTEFGVRALKNFDYSAMTWMGSGTGYTDVLGTGGIKTDNEINISPTGLISLKFGTFVCPTTYQADVTVLGNTFVLVCPFATGFKFKNVIAKKGAVAKSYFPNYSYAIAATSNDDLKGTVTGAGTFDKTSDVTLVASALAGNHFVNWTEGGLVVSTSASYTFSATAARTLVANFSISTGIGKSANEEFKVYPNPSNGNFNISSDAVGKSYNVTNLLGQYVTGGIIGSKLQKLDLTNQQAGTYMVIIQGENGKIVKSIVKN